MSGAGVLCEDDIDWGDTPPPAADPDPLVAALLDAEAYRWLAQKALAYAHGLHLEIERHQESYGRLRDEYRHFREQVMRAG